MIRATALTVTVMIAVSLIGCSEAWEMDYGKPAAQFLQQDVRAKAVPYIGEKITIKGTVGIVNVDNPESAWVILDNGIQCHFHEFFMMAQGYTPGDEIYVDGFLKQCDDDKILLDPALGRDPQARFKPQ